MIKYNELKVGDIVMAEYDGVWKEGEVIDLNGDEKQVCVQIEDLQEFWFEPQQLKSILLDEAQLFRLGFQKHVNDDGSVKYMHGAFRVLLPNANNFGIVDIWYREDKRHITHHMTVHEFQNNYLDMTKVHLAKAEA
ncbi:hypothetical protein [Aridibaculum aurantiacum]|uniref:hypothetical protein n=1 Tax=Aridibaculum aurantiacum TaxID=2810307 RepID=UPI001A97ADA4|nr:hypothetical protein [Aridibaculum aurantiacum]